MSAAKSIFWGALGVSAGALIYGALVESNRHVTIRKTLRLPNWPERLREYRIALLGDFHIRDEFSLDLAKRAIDAALDSDPDMVVMVGDYVGYWKPEVIPMLGEALEPLLLMNGSVVAVPGNHDYLQGDPSILKSMFEELNIKLLRNENWIHDGINWVGVDSANANQADPMTAMDNLDSTIPAIALWHEPDLVGWLPKGCSLCLSGHSHGGQFLTPWGKHFVGSKNGRRYRRGFYADASTPIYVTSGIGTTGPPSRLFCPPETVILDIEPA